MVQRRGDLAIEFEPHLPDLRDLETGELRARLVEREPGIAGDVFPDNGVKWRVEDRAGVMPEHALGDRVIAHQIAHTRHLVAGERHDWADVVAEVDEEPVRRRRVDQLEHLRPRGAPRDELLDGGAW